jgi:hypothetical protein
MAWSRLRPVVLIVLVVALIGVLYSRGFVLGLGGAPAELRTPFRAEEAWVVTEVVQHLTELSAAAGGSAAPVTAPTQAAPDHRYSLASATVDLGPAVWTPDAFEAVARAFVGAPTPAGPPLEVFRHLANLRAPVLVSTAADIDAHRRTQPRDAAGHEAAALAVGAFALREAAGRLTDQRAELNRITARLALARALRGAQPAGPDGQLADIVRLVLANHQRRAIEALDAAMLRRDAGAEWTAWLRALRLRVTQDWRALDDPATATRLEQLEFLRARRVTVPGLLGERELRVIGVDVEADTDWQRIVSSHGQSVSDSWLFTVQSLDRELAEARVVLAARGRQSATDAEVIAELSAVRATVGGVDVLPWEAWAAQFQRHLADHVANIDRHYRHRLGKEDSADEAKREIDARFAALPLLPLAGLLRTTGPNGGLADAERLDDAITLAA